MDNPVFIASACRTAIGSLMGQFSNTSAITLGSTVIAEAIKRAGIDPKEISEVVMGQVLTAGLGQNTARQAGLQAGIPNDIPAYTINMVCGSGLKAVYNGFNLIRSGEASLVVCGGMENMSLARHCTNLRTGKKLGNFEMEDTILVDGLVDPRVKMHMGKTAEHLAKKYDVSRHEQDAYALNSQVKAIGAIVDGYFRKEIVEVKDVKGNLIGKDEHVRFDASEEALSKLKPVFEVDGSVTAGNSSGINDGAAALLLCNLDTLTKNELDPMARIVGFAQSALDPMEMGLGPIKAVQILLKKINWNLEDVDLFELNEAFAVQTILVLRTLNIDTDKVNVSGGAIALGHPIGCSGARILVTLMYNLKRLRKTKGIAALCIGGGMGIAVAVEMITE